MINAKIIADSIHKGQRVVTFELDYPRYIHAELMTHRMFSRNAASSRAIPIEKMIEQVMQNTVMPMWTANKAGMQGNIITDGAVKHSLDTVWLRGAAGAMATAKALASAGAHKQNANRVLEPYQHMKTIVTATEYANWFNLRNHEDAQPEIRALAREMWCEFNSSKPVNIGRGCWHLPYVSAEDRAKLTLEETKIISASCCAQVSYRTNDASLEKAQAIYAKLVTGKPMHASPFEHQCRPLEKDEKQVGNLIGFRQLRADIEACNY